MDEKEKRGLYEAGAAEIFFKNFLAGFSRALGGIIVYLLFIIVLAVIFINFTLPKLLPMLSSYTNLWQSGSSLPQNMNLQNFLGQ